MYLTPALCAICPVVDQPGASARGSAARSQYGERPPATPLCPEAGSAHVRSRLVRAGVCGNTNSNRNAKWTSRRRPSPHVTPLRATREDIYGGDASVEGYGFETIYHYSRGTALLETGRVRLALEAFDAALGLAAASAHDSASPYSALVQAKGLAQLGLRRFR